MLIPIRCFTCGGVLANKYRFYEREVRRIKHEKNMSDNVVYLTRENIKKTPEGDVMDLLGLNKVCCRRHILTHVNIE
jgi:DNA-directed RNA polymerase I, II, and III subunit RPABC5